MNKRLRTVAALIKIWIVILATCSTAAGFILAAGVFPGRLVATLTGVFLLACGSAAINQVQDRAIDARMERTRRRPLPAGAVAPAHVLLLGLAGILCGIMLLALKSGVTPALLGLLAVLWYNGVYAWLKRCTPFAAVPGGIVGALPPVIGWTAGGGSPFDGAILALALCLFIWQVPHFWLLLLRHADDYEKSGLPVVSSLFSPAQLSRVTFVWIVSTVIACCMLPLFVIVKSSLVLAVLGPAGALLLFKAKEIIMPGRAAGAAGTVFTCINIYVLLVLSLLTLQVVV